jgi:hypothetical protein
MIKPTVKNKKRLGNGKNLRGKQKSRRDSTINIGGEKNSGIGIRRTGDIGIERTELVNVTSS